LIDVDAEPAGLLTLLTNPTGDVEVVTFGLVPDRQGQGLGGAALTLATSPGLPAQAERLEYGCTPTTSITRARCRTT
jgi:hypothetical protein